MKRFEYLEEIDMQIKDLNELGAEGWELINVYPASSILEGDGDGFVQNWYLMKRRIK
jgi:hypothetical protein